MKSKTSIKKAMRIVKRKKLASGGPGGGMGSNQDNESAYSSGQSYSPTGGWSNSGNDSASSRKSSSGSNFSYSPSPSSSGSRNDGSSGSSGFGSGSGGGSSIGRDTTRSDGNSSSNPASEAAKSGQQPATQTSSLSKPVASMSSSQKTSSGDRSVPASQMSYTPGGGGMDVSHVAQMQQQTNTGNANAAIADTQAPAQYSPSTQQQRLVSLMNGTDRQQVDLGSQLQAAAPNKFDLPGGIVTGNEMAKTINGENGPQYSDPLNEAATARIMLNRMGLMANKDQYSGTPKSVLAGFDANGYDRHRVKGVVRQGGNDNYRAATMGSDALTKALQAVQDQMAGEGPSLPASVADATSYRAGWSPKPVWERGVPITKLGPSVFSNPDPGRQPELVKANTLAGRAPMQDLSYRITPAGDGAAMAGMFDEYKPSVPTNDTITQAPISAPAPSNGYDVQTDRYTPSIQRSINTGIATPSSYGSPDYVTADSVPAIPQAGQSIAPAAPQMTDAGGGWKVGPGVQSNPDVAADSGKPIIGHYPYTKVGANNFNPDGHAGPNPPTQGLAALPNYGMGTDYSDLYEGGGLPKNGYPQMLAAGRPYPTSEGQPPNPNDPSAPPASKTADGTYIRPSPEDSTVPPQSIYNAPTTQVASAAPYSPGATAAPAAATEPAPHTFASDPSGVGQKLFGPKSMIPGVKAAYGIGNLIHKYGNPNNGPIVDPGFGTRSYGSRNDAPPPTQPATQPATAPVDPLADKKEAAWPYLNEYQKDDYTRAVASGDLHYASQILAGANYPQTAARGGSIKGNNSVSNALRLSHA